MSALPDITTPSQTRPPIDQMDMGMDLLRTVHAGMQDLTFLDRDALLALNGTMFVAIDILQPVRDVLNKADRSAPAKRTSPSLSDVINKYLAGSAAFQGWEKFDYPDEEAAIAGTYGPPMERLENWNAPAESLEDVREAIRLAFAEQALISDIATEPLRAALVYLEKVTGWKEQEGGAI